MRKYDAEGSDLSAVRSEAKDNPSVSASSTWRFEVRMSRIERFADDFDEVVDLLV